MFAKLKKMITPTVPAVGDVWSMANQQHPNSRVRVLRIDGQMALCQSLTTGNCLNLPIPTITFMYVKEETK